MPAQGLVIPTNAEAFAAANHNNDPHCPVAIRLIKQMAVFRMQSSRPGVHAMGSIQPDDGDALTVYLVLGVFQLHERLQPSQQTREGSYRPAR